MKVPAGDTVPVVVDGPSQINFHSAGEPRTFQVSPGGLYYFGRRKRGTPN